MCIRDSVETVVLERGQHHVAEGGIVLHDEHEWALARRCHLEPDLLREAVGVFDRDTSPADRDDLAALEVAKHAVYRHP